LILLRLNDLSVELLKLLELGINGPLSRLLLLLELCLIGLVRHELLILLLLALHQVFPLTVLLAQLSLLGELHCLLVFALGLCDFSL